MSAQWKHRAYVKATIIIFQAAVSLKEIEIIAEKKKNRAKLH